ncbi:MAG: tRNA pseudouridine(55) synthase TruB [Planctomycetota bacterium]
MRRRSSAPDGGLVVWKPRGPSSRQVIEQIEKRLGIRGLGHCGTLDPLASGVLVVIGGLASRFQQMLTVHDKCYEATVWFGIQSLSGDAEGPLSCPYPRLALPDLAQLEQLLPEFIGKQDQFPPAHSAVRVKGQRSYKRARLGDDSELPPSREIEIHSIDIIGMEGPRLKIRVECGPGTYIRSLARDLGQRLGCSSSLMALRRISSGVHREAEAILPDRVKFSDYCSLEELLNQMPAVVVNQDQARRLGHGQSVDMTEVASESDTVSPIYGLGTTERSAMAPQVVWCQDQVCGIAQVEEAVLRPRRWIPEQRNRRADQYI